MSKDIYYNDILDTWVDENEDYITTNKRYKELSKVMDPMYDFVLAYSNYYNIRRDYGFGPKLTMIEVHILTEISDKPGITVTELACKWNRTTSAISQTVRKLMKQDLVYRENSKTNGKIFHLYVTETGEKLVFSHKKYDNIDIVKTKKKLMESFSIDELDAFDRICKVYTELLKDKIIEEE